MPLLILKPTALKTLIIIIISCRREAATICPRLCDLDLEIGVRVMCDVGYLCANFGLPRPVVFST